MGRRYRGVAILARLFGCLHHQFGFSDTLAEQVLGPRQLFQTSKFVASLDEFRGGKCIALGNSLCTKTLVEVLGTMPEH